MPSIDSVRTAALRWWHIPELRVVEDELFGAEAWSDSMFWSELAAATRWYRVAVDDDRTDRDGDPGIAGYGGLCVYAEDAYIQTLAVRTAYQGSGLGTRLLRELLAEAERRSATSVALEVRADNAGAQRLYAAHGFEPVSVRRGYYQPSNVDAVVMIRSS